jgi:hypothetical protein
VTCRSDLAALNIKSRRRCVTLGFTNAIILADKESLPRAVKAVLRDIARMGFRNREAVLTVGASVAGMTFVSGNSHLSNATLLWWGV